MLQRMLDEHLPYHARLRRADHAVTNGRSPISLIPPWAG